MNVVKDLVHIFYGVSISFHTFFCSSLRPEK